MNDTTAADSFFQFDAEPWARAAHRFAARARGRSGFEAGSEEVPPPFAWGHRRGGFGGPRGPRSPLFNSFFGAGPGRGPRARRGDVRAAILALLREQPRNGYQIIQEIERRSGGLWRPSAGSVYPALQLLEDEGLIEGVEDGGRRELRLTEAGRAYADEHPDELAAPWATVADSLDQDARSLFEIVGAVAAATVQVGQAGNATQVARARQLLSETRKALYRILAEEDAPEPEA
ncbi:MAG: PadR family transcriptional regulator [Candidatus Dormibacteria bacterium]|jgi:DNA-binding PadR family transcriptional regulator